MASITATEVISSANDLLAAHSALVSRVRQSQQSHRRQLHALASPPLELIKLPLIPSPPRSPSESPPSSPILPNPKRHRPDLPQAKRARVARYNNYVPEEETIRNDYSQRYVDGGEWPQNWVLGAEAEHRFEEYPKQQRLLNLKKASVNSHSLPSTYLSFSEISSLHPCKFDVILLDPPFSSSFSWEHLQDLPIPALAADPSFVFLWVGSGAGEGLERGREVLARWGYRRCEDVVWVKTNKTSNRGPGTDPPTTSLLTRTKQHCLIGIRGTVRRSTDSWFVHCNVDTDVLIWEGDPTDPTLKPPETYTLIENFCLGTRRLEIFGKARSSLRRGWVTALASGQSELLQGPGHEDLVDVEGGRATKWEKESWEANMNQLANGGKYVVPMTADIDALRPKSPFRPGAVGGGGGGGGGMSGGTGLGMGVGMGIRGNGNIGRFGPNQNQGQMVQPIMGMGMMEGGMGWPMMGMGMGGMGVGMGVGGMQGLGGMGMMGMGMQPGIGSIAQQGMAGMGMNQPAMPGMAQHPMGIPNFATGAFNQGGGGGGWMETQGQQGGYMDEGMMIGNMGNMMGMGGMGMGHWGTGGVDGGNGYQ